MIDWMLFRVQNLSNYLTALFSATVHSSLNVVVEAIIPCMKQGRLKASFIA
jgi:hypothetical protein